MELITTKSFVSPLKGFLALPSGTQEKKSTITCKLDDKPRLYVIGNIRKVNQKIAHLELGLKRYDSSDVVIEDATLKRHAVQRGFKKGRGASKMKVTERDQKVKQKSGGHVSETESSIAQGKIAQKKVVTEKDKLVELYQYPGYSKEEPTPLPNGVELDEILEKVIRAQRKTLIGKPNREIQGHLFERIAENYSRALLSHHKVSNQELILTLFPSLLSQAVYTCFCYCFPRSWFNTHEFKAQLCDVFSEWLGGTLHAPGSYNKWDYSQLEPERSRREDLLSGKSQLNTSCDSFSTHMLSCLPSHKSHISSRKVDGKSLKKVKSPITRKKTQQQHSKKEADSLSQFVSDDDQVKDDGEKDTWGKQQKSQKKKKLKIALLPRESHPACCGPEFTWHHLNIGGHSPLIQHFLEKRHALSNAGCDVFLPRREICKPIPESAQTYAEVIKEGFNILRQRNKAFRKTYLRHQKEMRNFDQQCKDNQELFRQEMQEEMKRRQAQKQKELLTAEVLNSSEKISTHLPRVSFTLPLV